MSMIESLEGRVVFAATGIESAAAAVLNDPSVAVTVAKVQVDRVLVEAARADVREVATTGVAKVREIASAGKSLLAADRAQVKANRGDQVKLADARETLKADWAKVRADLAAARDALKADTAESRAALQEAVANLRIDLRQLRSDVKAATTTERQQLVDDVGAAVDNSGVTDEQVQAVVDRVKGVAQRATPISPDALRTLAGTVSAALDDNTVSAAEQEQITSDARALLAAANVSETDVRGIVEDAGDVVLSADVRPEDLERIATDLRNLFRAVVSAA